MTWALPADSLPRDSDLEVSDLRKVIPYGEHLAGEGCSRTIQPWRVATRLSYRAELTSMGHVVVECVFFQGSFLYGLITVPGSLASP